MFIPKETKIFQDGCVCVCEGGGGGGGGGGPNAYNPYRWKPI